MRNNRRKNRLVLTGYRSWVENLTENRGCCLPPNDQQQRMFWVKILHFFSNIFNENTKPKKQKTKKKIIKLKCDLCRLFQECNDTSWSPANCVPTIFSYCLPETDTLRCVFDDCENVIAMQGYTQTRRILGTISTSDCHHICGTIADVCALPKRNSNKTWYFSTYSNFPSLLIASEPRRELFFYNFSKQHRACHFERKQFR